MKIKDIINIYENMDRNDENFLGKALRETEVVGEYMNERAIEGKEIILNRINEEDFCVFMNVTRATLLSSMILEGHGAQLALLEITGELKMYTDTMILTILGVLADEEVI
jgi:hypothetical protein